MRQKGTGGGIARDSWVVRLGRAVVREPRSREQLVALLRRAETRRLIDPDTLAMIEGVLQVSELRVRDIMVPRSQMVVVQRDEPLEAILPRVIEFSHSRLPVTGEDRGEVIGIVLAKDLLPYCHRPGDARFRLRDVMRPAVVVPESKRLDTMLRDFRSSRNHMAIVMDEYGIVAGLVTIEDVMEQIVGEIEDEHDLAEESYVRRGDEQDYTVKALMPIEDFNEYFGGDLADDNVDTIGGLVLSGFGHVPACGEKITLERFEFDVLRADNRRVHLLRVRVLDEVANHAP